jgi:polyisoprenoid-binding protein YceI
MDMKYRTIIPVLLLAATLMVSGMLAGAQTAATPRHTTETGYRMSASPSVEMKLEGSTPISTWQMSAHGVSGTANMAVTSEEKLEAINALTFELPVHNLKGQTGAMEEHAYTALKADQYKNITFHLTSASIVPANEGCLVQATGTLMVAGVTRTVTLDMHGEISQNGTIIFRGAQNLRMSDYNVKPPSLLFGLVRARDEMTLTYTLIFTK